MTNLTIRVTPFEASFHIYKDQLGYWRWYFVTAELRRLADSAEFFHRREDCEASIKKLQALCDAPIVVDRARELVSYS